MNQPITLVSVTERLGVSGQEIESSLSEISAMPLSEEDKGYTFQDTKGGIRIEYADRENKEEDGIKVSLPKNYAEPIEIKLDEERRVTIQDNTEDTYESELLSDQSASQAENGGKINATQLRNILGFGQKSGDRRYLRYQNDRKSLLYAYQKDGATGERKMKHWTIYQNGTGEEKESYSIEGAILKTTENGEIGVYYQTEQDLKNDAVAKEVEPSLLDRAQRTLAKEMGTQNQNPDFIIPKPYYLDKDNKRQDLEWTIGENQKEFSLVFKVSKDQYPIALDPTVIFTTPGVSNGGTTITATLTSGQFGYAMAGGDFNADGKIDLAVGAWGGFSDTKSRVYIFYNDGSYPRLADSADAVIVRNTGYFGDIMTAGDVNADGRTDLIVGARNESRAYIYYNDGSYPSSATSADVTITGLQPASMETGDLNADGRVDLIIGDTAPSTNTGKAYIFYNDGSIPTTAGTADVTITGETTNTYFGYSMATGDFNSDGTADLAVGASTAGTSTGKTFIFYNDGSIPTTAGTADVTITGDAAKPGFGNKIATGDLNADGKTDLVVGGDQNSFGIVYIFYNDGSIPTTAATADVTITGVVASSKFGYTFAMADYNGDGRFDLGVGSQNVDRVYIFYNDGAYPSTNANPDLRINGDETDSDISTSLVAGDFNGDGKADLVAGANNYGSADVGRVYFFYSQNGVFNTNQSTLGESSSSWFASALTSGDFNADGRIDFAVGSYGYNPGGAANTGRAYIFYNDGSIPTTAATADVIITGNATNDEFGIGITAGDVNADGKTDLIVGAEGYSTSTGRAYIFYNDGSIPTTAGTADVTITGEATSNYFGQSLSTGDFNADGTVDLMVGARGNSSNVGRVYLFYNDGSIPTTAATSDVYISGSSSISFGLSVAQGDVNADGKIDIIAGATGYSSSTGRAYVFYGDGTNDFGTTTCSGSPAACSVNDADVTITGESTSNFFGRTISTGDLNADGKVDLVVGAYGYSTNTGRAYIFYNDGSIPTTAATADVTLTGETTSNYFSFSISIADYNRDGANDLAVGAYGNASFVGKVYIFNSTPATGSATTANTSITGTVASGEFGYALTSGDFNADGVQDLMVGAEASTGRTFLFTGGDNFSWTLEQQALGSNRIQPNVTGEEIQITGKSGVTGNFGYAMTSGDFNGDGRKDLAIGAETDGGSTDGKVYIFYNDGDYSSGATSADAIIAGRSGDRFGNDLVAGDMNADGKVDLIVAGTYTGTGYINIFYNDGSYPENASQADVVITGDSLTSSGTKVVTGDLNADGKDDLIVGMIGYSSYTGAAYIFYNDGSIPTSVGSADVTITGNATNDLFGLTLVTGDFNADGEVDLAVGARGYSSNTGRAYIFYNDGSIPTTAATADVTITGNTSSDFFSSSLASGDFNADGEIDLAVGAYNYSSTTGRVYIFYNDGSIPTTAGTADVTITGESSSAFGNSLVAGDLNRDGQTDLVVGSYQYTSSTGRAYIFYNDGSIPTTAATADVTLTGQTTGDNFGYALTVGDFNVDGKPDLVVGAYGYSGQRGRVYMYTFNDNVVTGTGVAQSRFGNSLIAGDFNSDGKIDLAVGSYGYSTQTGRVYIFYNQGGGSTVATASSADITITGNATSDYFGASLAVVDLDNTGTLDLVVGAYGYSTSTGRAYIFYNDGSIPTTAATADVTITGNATSDLFGYSLAVGDLNADGEVDLVVGAYGYSTNTGRAYIFYNDGSIPTAAGSADVTITGNATSDSFGNALITGDLNADGEVDLAVGASGYSSSTGRAYIFHNDGSIPTTAGTADVTITGETTSDNFGVSLATGDFNYDGEVDLTVGAYGYSSNTGRVYIFNNDGSIPTTAGTADTTISGSTSSSYFGNPIRSGDLNADGKTDLVIGSWDSSTLLDHAYVFYNDGTYPSAAGSADKIYDGESTADDFSSSLAIADFNTDSISDLIVGASGYSTNSGRIHIFISEVKTLLEPEAANLKGSMNLKGSFELK